MSRRGASVLARLATVAGSSAYVAPTTLSRVPSAALGGIQPVSITAVALGRVGHPCTARGFAASAPFASLSPSRFMSSAPNAREPGLVVIVLVVDVDAHTTPTPTGGGKC